MMTLKEHSLTALAIARVDVSFGALAFLQSPEARKMIEAKGMKPPKQ